MELNYNCWYSAVQIFSLFVLSQKVFPLAQASGLWRKQDNLRKRVYYFTDYSKAFVCGSEQNVECIKANKFARKLDYCYEEFLNEQKATVRHECRATNGPE